MYDAKSDNNRDRKGSISYIIGERKYFGLSGDNLFNSSKGFYANVHMNIFRKSKE